MSNHDASENEGEVPLIVAPQKDGFKYFSYLEEGEDGKPVLKEYNLDKVPSKLAPYLVEYTLSEEVADNKGDLPQHLRNLTVIDSKYSGKQQSSDVYFAILLPLFKAFGIPHVYVSTTSAKTIPDHAQSFSSSSTVVFLGGDTSIHEFVNYIAPSDGLKLTIAAVPTGTGNALATSLGHKSIAHAISRLLIGGTKHLYTYGVSFPDGTTDVATNEPIRELQSLVVTSWGFHAAIVADSDSPEYRKLGVARFQKAATVNLEKDQKYQGVISFRSGDESIRLPGPHSYVLFTLVSSLESTFVISPDSHAPTDKVRLVQFNQLPGDQIMELMMAAYQQGSHVKDKRITYKELTPHDNVLAEIEVHESDAIQKRWCVDGRIVVLPDGDHAQTIVLQPPKSTFRGWDLSIVQ